MKLNDYIVEIQMNSNFGIIVINVKEENADLALSKVQGMMNFKDEWIHLDDAHGNKYRIKSGQIGYLRVMANSEFRI